MELELLIERLFKYYTIRDIYEDCLFVDWVERSKNNTSSGFCSFVRDTFFEEFTKKLYPEMYEVHKGSNKLTYWFPIGLIGPRLHLVNKAIKLLEKKIEQWKE